MNICIIDSGLDSCYKFNDSNIKIKGITILSVGGENYVIADKFEDEIGHGTAIFDIFCNSIQYKDNKDKINFFIIKIFNNEFYTDNNKLLFALKYIDQNILCDLILISSGINILSNHTFMCDIIKRLNQKNVIIISAFDNGGAISYPAAFNNVIGIDTNKLIKKDEFVYVENSIVNLIGADINFRTKWIDNKKIFCRGSSYTTAYLSGVICNLLSTMKRKERSLKSIKEKLKVKAKQVIKIEMNYFSNIYVNKEYLRIVKKAIVFPFNKEAQSIAKFEDLLLFSIVNYYDIKESGKVNQKISSLYKYIKNDKVIENFENIDWLSDDFDLVICGHVDELSKLKKKNYLMDLADKCEKYNKKLYSFDKLDIKGDNYIFPYINKQMVPNNNLGKLHISSKPILGIFGTSSKQGKYTLQLELRKKFLDDKYKLAQIGTEPTGYLFNFDYVFPMGYNSTVYTCQAESITILNEMIHKCEINNADIIMVGSQSGSIPYAYDNVKYLTLNQYDFLLGTCPDIIVLCINIYDNYNYIKRTINYIESLTESKVIALAIMIKQVDKNKIINMKCDIKTMIGLELFFINYECDLKNLYNVIINYF